jgi:predicted DNA-binding antitoxin AbrB/MazE fold protein
MGGMPRQVEAVFENGLLRPLEPLTLEEHQQVTVIIEDAPIDSVESWIDHEYQTALEASVEPEPTLEAVRKALAPISGSLSSAVRAERDARG